MHSLNKDTYKIPYILLASVIGYLFVVRLLLVFSWSVDLDGTEFIFAHSVQVLMQGKPLYPDPLEFPFAATLYTPLYTYLLKFLCDVFGYGANDLHNILVVARIASMLAMFVNVYFIFRLFKLFKLPLFYFMIGITFYLLLITGHFYVTRPDALKTTLITVFIYGMLQYLFFGGMMKHLLLAVFSALVATFLKQDAILNVFLLLVPACFYLRNRKPVILTLAFSVLLFISLVACYVVFGSNFFMNTVVLNFQSLTDVINSINVRIILFSVARNLPLLALGLYGCYRVWKSGGVKHGKDFIPFAAIITFLATHAGMLRVGSYLNYSFESILLLTLNAALVIRNAEPLASKYAKALTAFAVVYLVALFASNTIIHSYSYSREKEIQLKEEYFATLKAEAALMPFARDGIVFFPNEKYVAMFPEMPMILGHDMHRGRFIDIYHGLHAPSKLSFVSSAPYDAWFTDGQVKYIIVDNDDRSKNHVSRFYPRFNFYTLSGNFCIYKYQSS